MTQILISSIWLILCGAHTVLSGRQFYATARAWKAKGKSVATSNYSGKHLLFTTIPFATFVSFFALGIAGLFTDTGGASVWLLLLGLAILPLPLYEKQKELVYVTEEAMKIRPYGLYAFVAALFIVAVSSLAIAASNTTPNAPFIYDDASVTVLNPDGEMPADDEMASYCAGQTLLVQFGGRSDGTGRSTHVSGTLLRIELGINDSIQLGEVAGGTYDKVTLVREPSEPQSFAILPPFSGLVIPETVTNGLYVWRHSNRAVDESGAAVSLVDSFTTEQFEIKRCESQNIP